MIYKMISKIYNIFYSRNIKKNFLYTNRNAKKNLIVETGVKIYNKNVIVGENVKLYHNVIIFGNGPVIIGDGTKIGYNTIIYSSKTGGVYIGKNCAIAANTYIIDTNHSTDVLKTSIQENDRSEKIEIGDNVWISTQCIIGMGSRLGDRVVVGTNSFVNKEFEDDSIIAGTPAKFIRYRGENFKNKE